MVAVDFTPGFEMALGAATPLTRYAAFVRDATSRRPTATGADLAADGLHRLLRTEAARLRDVAGPDWEAAGPLLAAAFAD
jgi:hypothetical protein